MLADQVARLYGDAAFTGLSRPPRSSLAHGAAGVAYFLYRYHARSGDPAALASAATWVARAEAGVPGPGAFVGVPPVFPDRRSVLPSSVLFGEAGVWWVAAQVHAASGDDAGVVRATSRFGEIAAGCADDRLDVAGGAAGLLLGAAVIVEGAPQSLVAVGNDLACRLERAIERPAPLAWLGAAHGWGGIAHALLRWCQATGTAPRPALTGLLEALREARQTAGVWPRRHDTSEVWPGWCHGSAGWAHLWVLAADVLEDRALLDLAEAPAVHAVLGRGAGASLCCGLAGQAYAALALYRASGETTWLTHGRRLFDEAAANPIGPDLPGHSLWGGDLGVALLALELDDPRGAAMPLYGTPP